MPGPARSTEEEANQRERKSSKPRLGGAEQAHLGPKIATYYEFLLDHKVPLRLKQLVNELERRKARVQTPRAQTR
jgi:hypothetical protein